MPDRILRWGLLSTAQINRALIRPLRASDRNQLVAVASRSMEQAESYAREWDIPRAHGSYESVLADPEVDVIYNPLPNHMHAEWTIKALHAGKHVLCEKPLVLSVQEVDDIAQAANETGNIVAEAFMYRHHPKTLKAKEIVDSGVLGDLQIIRGMLVATFNLKANYRMVKEMGGGSLWDVGCYPVSYTRLIVGEKPREVFGWQVEGAALSVSKGPTGIDETFMGQMRFEKGVLAQFVCGFASPFRTSMEIIGSKGSLNVPLPFHPGIFKPGESEEIYLQVGDTAKTIEIPHQELYLGEVEDMADAVLQGKEPRISLADSRDIIETIVGLFESARTGRP
ncbi:MAG TPA: Gfo/Idh/MocA family oxidoreductase, partial [Anaerolineales bacterium]